MCFWKLAKGDVYEQPFTVKEGDTMFDIAAALEKAGLMSARTSSWPRRARTLRWFATSRPTLRLRWRDFCFRPPIICRGIPSPPS
jgi:hypothetical protein